MAAAALDRRRGGGHYREVMIRMTRWSALSAAALAAAVAYAPTPASACSAPALDEALADSALDDSEAPAAPADIDVTIRRGAANECRLGRCERNSCAGVGFVTLEFTPPSDDQTAPGDLAYQLEVVDGEPVPDLIPAFAFRTFGAPGEVNLQWSDGATDDQEAIEFSVVLRAVDAAGNLGPPSDPIVIADPGGSAGCSIGGDRPGPLAAAFVLLLAACRRRR